MHEGIFIHQMITHALYYTRLSSFSIFAFAVVTTQRKRKPAMGLASVFNRAISLLTNNDLLHNWTNAYTVTTVVCSLNLGVCHAITRGKAV